MGYEISMSTELNSLIPVVPHFLSYVKIAYSMSNHVSVSILAVKWTNISRCNLLNRIC